MSLPKLFVFVILVLASLFLGKSVVAQIPQNPVDCDDTADPEFHSLRPYQKSPCNWEVSQTARFCGNRLVLTDSVTAPQPIRPSLAPNCSRLSNGNYRCTYTLSSQTANYSIDLSEADFPILGNTENVVNSQSQADTLDDAEKTNEYVSWYLGGVTGKAEYGTDEDLDKIVNFSGPIKKLLPLTIQNDFRSETVERAGDSQHDQVVGCINALKQITPCYPQRPGVREIRISAWRGNLPPRREDYEDFNDYWIRYRRWRGDACLSIFGASICADALWKPNYPGNLFSYIPFSSMEDRVGEVEVPADSQNVTAASPDLEISNVSLVTTPAELFFAHTEEVSSLAEKLQITFVPQGNPTTGGANYVSPMDDCDLTNIRSNDGDDLFAESITGSLRYDAEFSCEYTTNSTTNSCTKDVSVGLGVITKTPKADEIWSRLVAGPSAVFKRIFPKVGIGGAIFGILDMPAATKVTYSGSGLVYAGNPDARSGESAELYFPHIGGISEYFLKGIQTILRPKGFGEQIISGAPGTFASSGDINCDQNAPEVSLAHTFGKEAYFQLALNWVGQPGTHALECYNDTVRRAQAAGINVPLTLWIWIHESDASNYNISVQDFGAAYPAPVGYVDQINEYFRRARIYNSQNSLCAGRSITDMQAFAYLYQTGTCDPNAQNGKAAEYYNHITTQWSLITGCPFPSSTTDTSCQ